MGKGKKVRGKYEATNHSKAKCFLHILGEAEIHSVTKSQNMEIVNSLSAGKLWENTNIPKVLICYILHTTLFHVKFSKKILDEVETHATLKTWEK